MYPTAADVVRMSISCGKDSAKHEQGKAPNASVQLAPPNVKLPLALEVALATRLPLKEAIGKFGWPGSSKEAAFCGPAKNTSDARKPV